MGVCPAYDTQLIGNMFLELDQCEHVGTGSSEHIVRPEDHPHVEFIVTHYALDKLKAGAVIEFLINDRVPGNGDCPAGLRLGSEFVNNVGDLVYMHRLAFSNKSFTPVKEPAMVIVFEVGR